MSIKIAVQMDGIGKAPADHGRGLSMRLVLRGGGVQPPDLAKLGKVGGSVRAEKCLLRVDAVGVELLPEIVIHECNGCVVVDSDTTRVDNGCHNVPLSAACGGCPIWLF